MQESFYGLLADAKKRGRTVFMSSHVLSEVDRVCDRIAILRNGKLVLLSAVDESLRLATRRVRVLFTDDVALTPGFPPGNEIVDSGPRVWNLKVDGALGPLLRFIAPLPVKDLEIEEPKLEDVVMKYYREDKQ